MSKPNRIESRQRAASCGDDSNIQEKLHMRLQEIEEVRTERKSLQASQEIRDATVEALAKRAFHLPSNSTWKDDWFQYIANNHPFLGVCLGFRISPIGFGQRIISLAVSILIAISVTNTALLFKELDGTLNNEVVSISWINDEDENGFQITFLLLCLWFGASLLHAIHDALVWYMCCTKVMLGYLFWLLFWIGAAMMISAVVADRSDTYDPVQALIFASIEVGISWLIWYPVVATIIFSGILGCRSIPVLGGRPREVKLRQQQLRKKKSTCPMNTLASLDGYDASTVARTVTP